MQYLVTGALAAVVGVVAVFFVLRHKSVQTKSMYSARRGQIEHKVRAARQRTLGPEKKIEPIKAVVAPSLPDPPPASPTLAPPPDAPPQWDRGPTAPEPSPAAYTPTPAPVPEAPTAPEPVWTPTAAPEPVAQAPAADTGSQAWSVVGETKEVDDGAGSAKGKRKKGGAAGWELAGGQQPGDDSSDEISKAPSRLLAVAQYAVLVVGLVMVLIGVLVMVANSKVT